MQVKQYHFRAQELPERISSDEERELLSLLCRVHELEADKVSLQAERMARQAELRRRDLQLLRAERQRRLCEDIISTQRRIIEGKHARAHFSFRINPLSLTRSRRR